LLKTELEKRLLARRRKVRHGMRREKKLEILNSKQFQMIKSNKFRVSDFDSRISDFIWVMFWRDNFVEVVLLKI